MSLTNQPLLNLELKLKLKNIKILGTNSNKFSLNSALYIRLPGIHLCKS